MIFCPNPPSGLEEKAEREYEVFNKTQLIESDFDKEIKLMLGSEAKG